MIEAVTSYTYHVLSHCVVAFLMITSLLVESQLPVSPRPRSLKGLQIVPPNYSHNRAFWKPFSGNSTLVWDINRWGVIVPRFEKGKEYKQGPLAMLRCMYCCYPGNPTRTKRPKTSCGTSHMVVQETHQIINAR